MPKHELGYRSWTGRRSAAWSRFLTIPGSAIPIAWQSKMLRRAVLLSWLPMFYFAVGFFVYEWFTAQMLLDGEARRGAMVAAMRMSDVLTELGLDRAVVEKLADDPSSVRSELWSFMLFTFLRHPQLWGVVLVVGLVAPDLIAKDVRTRAFLLYFSKPLTRLEYLLGKGAVVGAFLGLISAAPALSLYAVAVLLSPELGVLAATWDIPIKVCLCSLVVALPSTYLALALSSVTSQGRVAAFSWYAIWILGALASGLSQLEGVGPELELLWLYHSLGLIQAWVMGIDAPDAEVTRAMVIVASVLLLSLVVLFRRISAPLRV
jgi:ABC-2 type transport system permease protein